MMRYKKASLVGDTIEWVEESDDPDLTSQRLKSCRMALEGEGGGTVGATNGIRLEVGRGLGDKKKEEGDGYLFWLGEPGQGPQRVYLILGDAMEEAGEELAVARMVAHGGKGGATEAAKKVAERLEELKPILVSKRMSKALGARVETAMREVALGVALAMDVVTEG